MTHAIHHSTPPAQLTHGSRLERASRSRLGQVLRARNREREDATVAGWAARSLVPLGVAQPGGIATGGPANAPRGFRNPLAPFAPSPNQRVLLPVIGVNDELTPTFERSLMPIAVRAASGDRIARDTLYAAFEPKLLRFSRRIRVPWVPTGAFAIWDRDDVAQEVYLAFLDVLSTWEEGIPFGRYVLAHFPWRLRDQVYRGIARSSVPPKTVSVVIDGRDWLADEAAAGVEERMLLDTLATSFGAPYDDIIRLHIGEGMSLIAVAARLGISRRTLTRRWGEVRERLRADLRGMRDAS